MPRGSTAVGIVADLWRYPVKSFGGERLRRAFLGPFGVLGDRRYAVRGDDAPLTARRAGGMLRFSAAYANTEAAEHITVVAPNGDVFAVGDDALGHALADALDLDAPATIDRTPLAFVDAAPLHILGEPSIAALADSIGTDLDRRRFRANILVEPATGAPFEEDTWIGKRLTIGEAVIEVIVNTERCVLTTLDPDTAERDPRVLKALATSRENLFGVYARVLRPSWIATGDAILTTEDG